MSIKDGLREYMQAYMKSKGVPSMIYYPLPLQKQEAFYGLARKGCSLQNADMLTQQVLSLPIHTEMTGEEVEYIIETICNYEHK